MKLTKRNLFIGGGYILFILLFWLIGAHSMSQFTAFFGLAALTAVYAGAVWTIGKIYPPKS
ncbi:MAG: hypothetical protein WC455_19250 [Dehalococcoidia bacterium]|jgi:hypothetical protein